MATAARRHRNNNNNYSSGNSSKSMFVSTSMSFWIALLLLVAAHCCQPVLSASASSSSHLSEDYDNEDSALYDRQQDATARTQRQIVLPSMELQLRPTPLPLPNIEEDLAVVLDRLVTQQMTAQMGAAFVYFLTTAATAGNNEEKGVQWYGSGQPQRDDTYDSHGETNHPQQQQQQPEEGNVAYTRVVYKGAVVMVDATLTKEEQGIAMKDADAAAMETMLQAIIEGGLVDALKEYAYQQQQEQQQEHQQEQEQNETSAATTSSQGRSNHDTTIAPYFEIESVTVLWDTVSRNPPVLLPADGPPPNDPNDGADEDADGGGGLTDPPPDNVDFEAIGLEASNSSSNQNKITTTGQTTGIVIGSFLAVSAVLFFWVQHHRRRRRQSREIVVAQDHHHHHGKEHHTVYTHSTKRNQRRAVSTSAAAASAMTSSNVMDGEDDAATTSGGGGDAASERAHYQEGADERYQQGELLECVSVASETWTLGTDGESSLFHGSSNGGGGGVRLQKAAELLAAKETFDRDRQVTLQKDMLQTAWSSSLFQHHHNHNQQHHGNNNNNVCGGSGATGSSRLGGGTQDNTLSFEQAYDSNQGEEIYLMPPRSRSSSSRGNNNDHDEDVDDQDHGGIV